MQREETFPRLSDDDIEVLAGMARRRSFADGERLVPVETSQGAFFVVLAGEVEIVDRTSERRRLALHGPREFTGDIDILTGRRVVGTAVAHGDTEVLEISAPEIRRLITERPNIGEVILRAFIARRQMLLESDFAGIRVIGSGADPACYQLREFLSRNQVPFTWLDLDQDEAVGDLLEMFGLDGGDLPAVISAEDVLLRNPSVKDLARAVGLRRRIEDRVFDLIVVGAGPAGLAAAVYGASEGLATLVLDADAPGGQASSSQKIENYLGFPTGITGAELTSRATLQAQKFGARISTPSPVRGLQKRDGEIVVSLDEESARGRCVIVATGAEYRKLDVPRRERFEGVGLYYAATATELSSCGDSEVIVVGGGNSAGQAVMFLAEKTRGVNLLLRGRDLRRSMSSYLADRIEATENVHVHTFTEIRRLMGEERLEAVEVEETRSGERRTIRTPAVFTFIGATPHTEYLPPDVETDDGGFVLTGSSVRTWPLERQPHLLETSLPGVFAVGDVRHGSIKRVASAVGEGSMVVKFVHEYLADLNLAG